MCTRRGTPGSSHSKPTVGPSQTRTTMTSDRPLCSFPSVSATALSLCLLSKSSKKAAVQRFWTLLHGVQILATDRCGRECWRQQHLRCARYGTKRGQCHRRRRRADLRQRRAGAHSGRHANGAMACGLHQAVADGWAEKSGGSVSLGRRPRPVRQRVTELGRRPGALLSVRARMRRIALGR